MDWRASPVATSWHLATVGFGVELGHFSEREQWKKAEYLATLAPIVVRSQYFVLGTEHVALMHGDTTADDEALSAKSWALGAEN